MVTVRNERFDRRDQLRRNKRARFLDFPLPQERGLYAEETARQIDDEVKRILTERTTARAAFSPSAARSRTVTRRLLEVEVMEGEELRRFWDCRPRAGFGGDDAAASARATLERRAPTLSRRRLSATAQVYRRSRNRRFGGAKADLQCVRRRTAWSPTRRSGIGEGPLGDLLFLPFPVHDLHVVAVDQIRAVLAAL